ncbi:DUF2897 family protein [Vibrio sp. S4M6]|uniref:DUF2897 family protein n=1 Tax=Vibrio sinus TaxID=2946865 RepID=UPI002029EEC9|nr:DUF2897 family protein [Vibrio sinus]
MIDWLFNPWVIAFVVISIIAGNIAALKYSAKVKLDYLDKRKSDLDKLNELSEQQSNADQIQQNKEEKSDKTKAE